MSPLEVSRNQERWPLLSAYRAQAGHVNVLQIGHVDTPRPLGLGLPPFEVTVVETLVEAGDKRPEVHGVLTGQQRPIGTEW